VVAVPCTESDEALARTLDDPESSVRLASIREIGEHDKRTLGTVLLHKLPSSPPEVQDEILLTLARWKMGAVVPVATDLLLGPKKLFGRRSGLAPSNVRARCAWVLGQFLPDPQLESVLRQALSDNDPVVRRNVEGALQHKRT
jgi:HEAT repeat protein